MKNRHILPTVRMASSPVIQTWRERLRASDPGQALVFALIALAVGVILVSVFVAGISMYLKLSTQDAASLQTYYAADAGVELAIAPLAATPDSYASSTSLSLRLNGRDVVVNVAPLGSQTSSQPTPGGSITTTVSSYLVTSSSSDLAIKARVEARKVSTQPSATVRITAWRVGP